MTLEKKKLDGPLFLYSEIAKAQMPASMKAILWAMTTYINDNEYVCWPSLDTLAFRSGMSQRQVAREVKKLKKLGVLSIDRPNKDRASNTYTIHAHMLPCLHIQKTRVYRDDSHDTESCLLVTDKDIFEPPCGF